MEYKTVLKVSDSELYYTLLDSVIAEAINATGKNITEKDLVGGYKYKYRKEMGGKNLEITTHIKQPVEKKKIQLNVERQDNHYEMIYEIKYIDKNETEITYTQTDKYQVKNFLQKWKFNSGMKKRFGSVEKYIIQKRKEK